MAAQATASTQQRDTGVSSGMMRTLVVLVALGGLARADSSVTTPTPATRMQVRIQSNPFAWVRTDQDRELGQTPLHLQLPAEPFRLTLLRPGYGDVHQAIRPSPNVEVRILMTKLEGPELRAQLAAAIRCDGLDSKPKLAACGHLINELTQGIATLEPVDDGWKARRAAGQAPTATFRTGQARWQTELTF